MFQIDTQVALTLITVLGGIFTTYIVKVLAKRKKDKAPKDRMEGIFDGYESLIKRQDDALNYKDEQLKANQDLLQRMQLQMDQMRDLIDKQREELEEERTINRRLHEQLDEMRRTYNSHEIEKAETK